MGSIDFDQLLAAAREARHRAYAPYSNFPVGAALLTAAGRVYPGCNIENAAYSMCLCAERTALASAIAQGEREFQALAVIAASDEPVPPCGACRQMLAELAPDMPVLLASTAGATRLTSTSELLPGAFTPDDLAAGQTRRAEAE